MTVTELFRSLKHKKRLRFGRGISAGKGKTAGRGTKGQRSRSGANRKLKAWFEGGQTPLYRRLPKRRGFTRHVAKPVVLTTTVINYFYTKDGETVSLETLLSKKVLRRSDLKRGVKIVSREPLKAKLKFDGVALTKSLQGQQK